MDNTPTRLRRTAASQYLKEKYGIERTPGTLAKLSCEGGGPRFQHANRIPLYPTEELDRWAESILSPLKKSTSDNGETLRASGATERASHQTHSTINTTLNNGDCNDQ